MQAQTRVADSMEIDGTKLYYEMAGEGKTVVLAHAGFLDSGMWDAQWEAFTRHYRVIRYDMRGYGKSDAVHGPVSRREELYRLLQHLEVESAYLIGCSLGGEVMIDFVLEHPEMVAALIPISAVPSGFEMQGEPPAELMQMIGAMQAGELELVSELQIRLWIDGPFRQPEQVDPAVRQHAAQMNQLPVRHQTWAIVDSEPLAPLMPPAAERLQQIAVPTLIMAGALDNAEILRAADVMADQIAGAQKTILPDCAHVPNMEKPEMFNQIVLEFLDNL